MKKLSRREAALVRHARKQASRDYEQSTRIVVKVNSVTYHDTTLEQLRLLQSSAAGHKFSDLGFSIELVTIALPLGPRYTLIHLDD